MASNKQLLIITKLILMVFAIEVMMTNVSDTTNNSDNTQTTNSLADANATTSFLHRGVSESKHAVTSSSSNVTLPADSKSQTNDVETNATSQTPVAVIQEEMCVYQYYFLASYAFFVMIVAVMAGVIVCRVKLTDDNDQEYLLYQNQ